MKGSCRVHREAGSALLDGAATPAETAAMEAHLETCAECRTALEELRWTTSQIRKLDPVEPPPWMTAKIMARVRSESTPAPSLWRRLFVPILASPQFRVASLVLAGAAGTYLVTRSPEMLRERPAALEARRTATPVVSEAPVAPPPAPEAVPPVKADFAPPPPLSAGLEKKKGSARLPEERRAGTERPLSDAAPAGSAPEAPAPVRAAEPPAPLAPAPAAKASAAGPAREETAAPIETGAASGVLGGHLASSSALAPAPPRAAKQAAPSAAGEAAVRDTMKKERSAAVQASLLVVSVAPADPAGFLALLEGELKRFGAEYSPPPADLPVRALTARLDSRRLPELIDRLSRAGTIRERPESGASLPPVITVTIRW